MSFKPVYSKSGLLYGKLRGALQTTNRTTAALKTKDSMVNYNVALGHPSKAAHFPSRSINKSINKYFRNNKLVNHFDDLLIYSAQEKEV